MTDPAPASLLANPLGTFLRARREALSPESAGLPAGTGRRTPGLRRAELAALAGVSVEYLTRLERGTDRRPSPQVLAALAGALGLTEDEHVHLLRLVKTGEGLSCAGVDWPPELRPGLLALLDGLAPAPAALLDRSGSVLACTERFRAMIGAATPNLPSFVFCDPDARHTFPDWSAVADEWAVRLRAAADLGDGHARVLGAELALRAGTEFLPRYDRANRVPAWTGVERWRDPDGTARDWRYEAMLVPESDEYRLLVYLPG